VYSHPSLLVAHNTFTLENYDSPVIFCSVLLATSFVLCMFVAVLNNVLILYFFR
jgi:hypothetical protein